MTNASMFKHTFKHYAMLLNFEIHLEKPVNDKKTAKTPTKPSLALCSVKAINSQIIKRFKQNIHRRGKNVPAHKPDKQFCKQEKNPA